MAGTIDELWSLGLLSKSAQEEEEWRRQHNYNKSRRRPSDLLWHEYFRDPSQWCDNRNSKAGPALPDFKHKVTRDSLWTDGLYTPSGVAEELRRRGDLCDINVLYHHKRRTPLRNDAGSAFIGLLRACAKNKDLSKGTALHDDILNRGLLEQCSDALVTMYAKCGVLAKAKELLDTHKSRDVFSWTALIAGYVRQGQSHEALNCFERMQHEGLSPDGVTFTCVLKACGSIRAADKGKQIHDEIARQGLLGNDVVLGTALIDMYAKCGALEKAHHVLEELPFRDVVCWNSLITGYSQQGQGEQALKCFEQMQCEGLSPDAMTFAGILKACGTIGATERGQQVHAKVVKEGLLGNDIVLGNALVDMYAKCGALAKARRVLEEFPSRDVVTWSALITGCIKHGQAEQALNCFERMHLEGLSPDAVIFSCILKACGTIGALDKGEQIHDEIARQGLLGNNIVLGTALVDMYAKCGVLAKAQQVHEDLPYRNVASWNSLIRGYAQQDQGEQALNCFEQMQCEGLSPDTITFACILRACAIIRAIDKGEQIHDEIARQGLLGKDVVLGTALIDMYAKCGSLANARRVLEELHSRDAISWNALIAGYTEQGQGEQALNCFEQMQQEGFSPDAVTFICILKACGTVGAIDKGEQIHDQISRQGLLGKDIVLGTALVDMYAKCGALANAAHVLEELPSRDVVSWNSLIAGYAQEGQGEQALNCLEQMRSEGICPDAMTFACILKACGSIAAIDKGEQIHDEIARQGLLEKNIVLGTALVDMYAKSGSLRKAQRALEDLPSRNTASWNALMAGYTKQGQGGQALTCFECMQHEGLSPDGVTFSCVLNACSHLGLVEDGHVYFTNMRSKYGVKPDVEHYICMVDLFGRAGHLEKAVSMIEEMPCSDYTAVWCALLGACGKWGDVNVGRWAFEQAIEVDKSDGAAYVLMANIYAAAGMQEDAEIIEAMSLENKARV